MNEDDSKIIKDRETISSNILVEEKGTINIDEKKRIIIFIVLFVIAIFSGCDGGIIPQQNSKIQKEFGGNGETRIGLFGSIDYIGRIVGAIIFTIIMGKTNRKSLLISTLLFKSITLFIPLITYEILDKNESYNNFDKDYYINITSRCLSGLSQVFYLIYLPVWCDQYAKKKKKTIWITEVEIGFPIGIIIGYGLGFLSDSLFEISGWRISFALIGIILFICAIIIMFFHKIYFSEKFILIEDSRGIEENDKIHKKELTIFSNLCKILSNKLFLFSSLCNSITFFGTGVVQFFASKYMEVVLELSESKRFLIYVFLCLFGSIVGMFFGGAISSVLGGYVKKNSMIFVIILMIISSCSSMLIACHKISILFSIACWIYLFGMGAIIPPLSGIIISSLDNNLRGDGFSICSFLSNLIGNFPSSYVYSLLVDAFENNNSTNNYRYAMMICMAYNFIGLLFVIIAGTYRFRIEADLSKTKENNLIEGKEENNENEWNEEEDK